MFGRTAMTFFHLHHDVAGGFVRKNPLSISRLFRRVGAALRLIHRGIVGAKLHRVRTEMLFRLNDDEMFEREHNASKFLQRPLILGDKWDF
jgi:hypothetical protein